MRKENVKHPKLSCFHFNTATVETTGNKGKAIETSTTLFLLFLPGEMQAWYNA